MQKVRIHFLKQRILLSPKVNFSEIYLLMKNVKWSKNSYLEWENKHFMCWAVKILDKLSFSLMFILYWFYSLNARNICQIILMSFISINNKSEKLNYYPDSFRSQSKILGISGEGFFGPWYNILKDRGHEWGTFVFREPQKFCHIACELPYLFILRCDTFYIYH